MKSYFKKQNKYCFSLPPSNGAKAASFKRVKMHQLKFISSCTMERDINKDNSSLTLFYDVIRFFPTFPKVRSSQIFVFSIILPLITFSFASSHASYLVVERTYVTERNGLLAHGSLKRRRYSQKRVKI